MGPRRRVPLAQHPHSRALSRNDRPQSRTTGQPVLVELVSSTAAAGAVVRGRWSADVDADASGVGCSDVAAVHEEVGAGDERSVGSEQEGSNGATSSAVPTRPDADCSIVAVARTAEPAHLVSARGVRMMPLGITILPVDEVPDGEPDYRASSSTACQLVGLVTSILEATGPELNWGTFTSAGWNLGEVDLPGAFEPLYYDKDHPNGSPILYVYDWDPASGTMVRDED